MEDENAVGDDGTQPPSRGRNVPPRNPATKTADYATLSRVGLSV